MSVVMFPVQDSFDKYQVSHVHRLAVEMGLDPRQAVRDFLTAENPKQQRAEMAEQARRARMQQNIGEMA
ncbi:hypothetical protein [Xanthomonas sp. LMG 12461]|uniref:hypothetical protein n=1 Tax=Xanthomonas sp. LMG 12461 TaxID=2014543 RepID=UPI00126489DD|nr:hypothetical protein [Xanthomonas sp. LMG 12461]KAB7765373.1 hypothetical protein CEK68_11770 [Xanthomonas sp. LMG 12461]